MTNIPGKEQASLYQKFVAEPMLVDALRYRIDKMQIPASATHAVIEISITYVDGDPIDKSSAVVNKEKALDSKIVTSMLIDIRDLVACL